jgi:hypothetical protein
MADAKCRWQCPEDWVEWSQWLAAGLDAHRDRIRLLYLPKYSWPATQNLVHVV